MIEKSSIPGGPLLRGFDQFSIEEWRNYYLLAKEENGPLTFIKKEGLKKGIASPEATLQQRMQLMYSGLAETIYVTSYQQMEYLPEKLHQAIMKYCKILKIDITRGVYLQYYSTIPDWEEANY